MKYILVRVEALGDKIILHRENSSFEDLLTQGAVSIPNTGYIKSVNKKVNCFFTEKRNGDNLEYEPTIADYRCAEFNENLYMEIYDFSLKGGKESLDAFIWEGEFGLAEEIPLEAYHKIEFVEG